MVVAIVGIVMGCTKTTVANKPVEGTPAERTPAAETPAAETPAAGRPAETTPAAGTPADGKLTAETMLAAYAQYVDRVCKCTDTRCVADEGEEYVKRMAKFAERPDPEELKRMRESVLLAELNKKYQDCIARIVARPTSDAG